MSLPVTVCMERLLSAPMRARRHTNLRSFVARVEPTLLGREAENNLPIGLLADATPPLLVDVEDDTGEIVAVAIQTPPFNLVVTRAPKAALDALVELLVAERITLPGVIGVADAARHVARSLASRHGLLSRVQRSMRIFENRQLIVSRSPMDGGLARTALDADLPLICSWTEAFWRDTRTGTPTPPELIKARVRNGQFLLWETDRPVSMAGVVARTPNGARIGFVYTPDKLRGRGYASAVTAAVTEREHRAGRTCFLYTDRANPTSNKIYQAIGYTPVCDVEEWRFDLRAERHYFLFSKGV